MKYSPVIQQAEYLNFIFSVFDSQQIDCRHEYLRAIIKGE